MEQSFIERFREVHSKGIADFVSGLKGEKVKRSDFVGKYVDTTSMRRTPCKKRRQANKTFNFLIKHGWIEEA